MARIQMSENNLGASEDKLARSGSTTAAYADGGPIGPGTPVTGEVNPGGEYDYYTLNVIAGQSYVISMNGTGANAMPDPQLFVYNNNFTAYVGYDDEGGTGSNSLLTFTATYTGVVYVEAGAWSDATHAGIPGEYTLAVAERGADVSNTIAGAQAVAVGSSTLSFMEQTGGTAATAFSDVDFFKVDLVAGQYYEFQVSAGWDYYAGPEGDLRLHVMDGSGTTLAFGGDISSGDQNAAVAFVAQTSGTYYLRISHDNAPRAAGAQPNTGYELSVKTFDLSGLNPLDAINWGGDENVVAGSADGEITVYFAGAGEVFDGQTSLGWTAYEQQQAMLAFQQYSNVLPVTYRVVTSAAEADFKLVIKTQTAGDTPGVLGYFNPPGEDQAGVGVFWRDGFGWDEDGPSVVPATGTDRSNGGLEQGGYAFYTLVHEFGHAMGLSHPHDTGGGSSVMAGVFGAFGAGVAGTYGAFDMNQGVYTIMSYNSGWSLNPANAPYTVPWYIDGGAPAQEADEAYNGGLSALDIAMLQLKYGANTTINTGDNVYVLPAANDGNAFFSTLWDAGGIDTIAHNGTQSARIDLTAATIDYSATGAGVLSHANGVYGGFTIAQGTVIENASGGSGNDVLIGNSANNVLAGNAGNDTLMGRDGIDRLIGGDGVDTLFGGDGVDYLTGGAGDDFFMGEIDATTVATKNGSMSVNVITDFTVGDKIDLRALDANLGVDGNQEFAFKGTGANKAAGDLTYKTYTSINGAENALGYDIDGVSGAGAAGPVTIIYGNVDGNNPDFAIVLLGVSAVSSLDFHL